MTAMPVMIGVLCVMAIAYRYYSAFLAAKVAALDDTRTTPAMRLDDGQNYHPTSKWVLFGHHFAAISGAGPLVGPVLAAQFGYMPGLLWIVIGVCLGGAVQDFLVLAASVRRNGKSLAQIAAHDVGPVAGTTATIAILFIIVIALAGLGKVVVNALGGDLVKYPPGSTLVLPPGGETRLNADGTYKIPGGTTLKWGNDSMKFPGDINLQLARKTDTLVFKDGVAPFPKGALQVVPGSSWGTFTIAATIPIALFVGLYMYRLRKGRVIEASLIGGGLVLAAVFVGGYLAHSRFAEHFNLSAHQITLYMAAYGFLASVLPVWVLLVPRDYLSSFLKLGTIFILVAGVIIANPRMEAPALNHVFSGGGPAVPGNIFPFLFITIMCGAISGFHALVSSGTTPKMVRRESDTRTIGFGAMLMEGLVGVVALVAACTLPTPDYYGLNTALSDVPKYHDRILQVGGGVEHLNNWEQNTQETLRGRSSGAVTLAVGMANIFDQAAGRFFAKSQATLEAVWKYWYHFAIMFEALFILTTIDAGTRIGRFLLQEAMGKVIHPKLGQTDWWPSAVLSTALIVAGWAYFIGANEMKMIWPMFGISNQMLAVIALAVISAYLANEGRSKYLWVTIIPMLFVATTTFTAGAEMLAMQINGLKIQFQNAPADRNMSAVVQASVLGGLILAMLACGSIIMIASMRKVWRVSNGTSGRPQFVAAAEGA
ncbi:MAG TPA: carbon starvation protein A [Tepidisphaeraceae bacterium]|nr:carbon starvation protein A [Tepidisphaeraceae bacterium]